jgi:hypothetical protein
MPSETSFERNIRRKPDVTLRTAVQCAHGRVDEVPCSVYLPRTVTARPYLIFRPSPSQFSSMQAPEFSFSGQADYGSHSMLVSATNVYPGRSESLHLTADITECTVTAVPWDLRVTRRLRADQPDTPIRHGFLWLTPNRLLSPALILEGSFTGEVKVTTVREISFTLPSGRVVFRKRFLCRNTPQGTLRTTELVAEIAEPIEPSALDGLVEELDDVLLLASLAQRHRCVCRGWDLSTDRGVTSFYRSSVFAPRPKTIRPQETLVDAHVFEGFLCQSFSALRSSSSRNALRRAIWILLDAGEGTLEGNFLKLFTALETLVTSSRETSGFTNALSKETWKSFRKDLKSFVNSHALLKDRHDSRGFIIEKLSEINRIAFRTVFDKFVESLRKYGLSLDDLWPITRTEDGVSIIQIRNRMTHGDSFSEALIQSALFDAKSHLEWSIERILLAMLGWPVDQSNVGKFLRHFVQYNSWKAARRAFGGSTTH